MISTLKRSKAQLSALVDRAARGEEIVITVRGRPKARLCPLVAAPHAAANRAAWARELQKLRRRWSAGKSRTSRASLDAAREDRL